MNETALFFTGFLYAVFRKLLIIKLFLPINDNQPLSSHDKKSHFAAR
jgi:hypothetical protein